MKEWLPVLAMDLLIPLVMTGFGRRFMKKPPARINGLYGYRTARSMKSRESWDFAHRYCGRLWYRWGLALVPLTLLCLLPFLGKGAEAAEKAGGVLCLVQLVPLAASIPPTEAALKRNFDENGRPRRNGDAAPEGKA